MAVDTTLDWSSIDTVLLDMDGTLLDLRFDNWFWREHLPSHYASINGMTVSAARALLEPRFTAVRGTMEWYCIDHWSRELDLDIARMKRAVLHEVRYLAGAEAFLRKLRLSGRRRVLVTNAHPITLAFKDERVGLAAHFDACHSTHAFCVPKEQAAFWPRLRAAEPFDPGRTLLVDDSVPVLDAAKLYGIRWLRAIRHPDSGAPAQLTGGHVAVDGVADLL